MATVKQQTHLKKGSNKSAFKKTSKNVKKNPQRPKYRSPRKRDLLPAEARQDFHRAKAHKNGVRQRVKGGMLAPKAESIAMAIAIPENGRPFRFPSEFASVPTAIGSPWTMMDIGFATDALVGRSIANAQATAMLFRDPFRSMVIYDANLLNKSSIYNLWGVSRDLGTVLFPDESASPVFSFVSADAGLPVPVGGVFCTPDSASQWQPHGSALYAHSAKNALPGSRFFWIDKGSEIQVTWTSTPALSTVAWGVEYWDGNQLLPYAQTTLPVVGDGLNPEAVDIQTQHGYFALYAICDVDNAVITVDKIQILCAGDYGNFRHLSLANLPTNIASIDQIRVSAGSMRFTNRAPTLSLAGEVAMYQTTMEKSWMNLFTGSSTGADIFSVVSKFPNACTMKANEGMFGFLRPFELSDFDFHAYATVKNGHLIDVINPVSHKHPFMICAIKIANEDGRDGYWRFDHGVEYTSMDVWRAVSCSNLTEAELRLAMIFLKSCAQYHKNAIHIGELWSAIQSAGRAITGGIAKYGPKILALGEAAAPLFL
jgi:hypothetical protein